MDLGLQGKRALVTGSTAGIGFAAARSLAAEGAQVTINGRTAARVNAAVPGPTASEGVGQFVRQLAESQAVDVATVERQFSRPRVRPPSGWMAG